MHEKFQSTRPQKASEISVLKGKYLIKMSKNGKPQSKMDRGTSLSSHQYSLLYTFLQTGQKPTVSDLKRAGLYGTLNGGKDHPNLSTYFRFKSIAKRLKIRQLDQELVFKANNKIVLPSDRFNEVIRDVHKGEGRKHLNITRTMEKLSEKFTIGCRQFGISETHVRVVVKRCREGSCARKAFVDYEHDKNKAMKQNDSNVNNSQVQAQHNAPQQPTNLTYPPISYPGYQLPAQSLTYPLQLIRWPVATGPCMPHPSCHMTPATSWGTTYSQQDHMTGAPIMVPIQPTMVTMPNQVGAQPQNNTVFSRMPNLASLLMAHPTVRYPVLPIAPMVQQSGPMSGVILVPVTSTNAMTQNLALNHTTVQSSNISHHSVTEHETENGPIDVNNNILTETRDHIIINNLNGSFNPSSYLALPSSDITHDPTKLFEIHDLSMSNDLDAFTQEPTNPIDLTVSKSSDIGNNVEDKSEPIRTSSDELEVIEVISQDSDVDVITVDDADFASQPGTFNDCSEVLSSYLSESPTKTKGTTTSFETLVDAIHEIGPDIRRAIAGNISARYKLRYTLFNLETILIKQKAWCSAHMK